MNGIMKVVTLNNGRYIGLPKHIANIVEEAAKYRCTTEGDNIIKLEYIRVNNVLFQYFTFVD